MHISMNIFGNRSGPWYRQCSLSVDVGDDNDLGYTGNIACDSAQSAMPEVSCSMQTGCCLGKKHIGPSQPHLPKYPSTKAKKQNRSFNQDWFQKFPWIEYSTHEDAVFCFPCRHFQTSSAYNHHLSVFRVSKQPMQHQ